MRKKLGCWLAALLAVAMVFCAMPMPAFAADDTVPTTAPVSGVAEGEGTTTTAAAEGETSGETTVTDTTTTTTTTTSATETTTSETQTSPAETTTAAPVNKGTVTFNEVSAVAEDDELKATTVTVENASIETNEKKEVYVLVNSISGAGDYLISNTRTATPNANLLTAVTNDGSNVTNTSGVTVTEGVNAEGTAVIYIENPKDTTIWTASSYNNGYHLYNSSTKRYLRYDYGLKAEESEYYATAWRSGTNTVYRQSGGTRYIKFENSNWTTDGSSRSVYIYKKQTVTLKTTTVASGTYSISGENVEKIVTAGTTAALSSTLTFEPKEGTTTTEDTSAKATYEVVEGGEIILIKDNTVTFTGVVGTATVKISYTIKVGGENKTVTNYITITANPPTYLVDITHDPDGDEEYESATSSIAIKGVAAGKTYDLNAAVTYDDGSDEIKPVTNPTIVWSVSGDEIATVDENGTLTFNGDEGIITVTASYVDSEGKVIKTDSVNVSASKNHYYVPNDGTNDFPEYPNEGAVRMDKNAVAVGNFSETGITKVELSMTGVPYSTDNEIDVVIMADMSTSMTKNSNGIADRVTPAKNAVIAALNAIVKNEDGTYNNNRVAIYTFAGSLNPSSNGYCDLQTFDASTVASMTTKINNWKTASATNYTVSLEKCQQVLAAAQKDGTGDKRQQFCIFITDGSPSNGFTYLDTDGTGEDMVIYQDFSDSQVGTTFVPKTEYYSYLMKQAGVNVYTVGVQMFTKSGYSTVESKNCKTLLRKIAGTQDGDATTSKNAGYARFVESDVSIMTTIFEEIVNEIKEAATNVTVTDKITDEYSMILQAPNSKIEAALPDGQTFSIDVLKYTLDADKKRVGTPAVIETVTVDSDKVTTDADGNIIKIDADNFTYDAATQIIIWKADKLDSYELALSYYLYLNESAGTETEDQVDSGTYPTNEYASITYTNHLDHECKKEFPVPQLTWNGAQVSYTFYLVNEKGQPVNRAGRVIPFAEAVYVTDVYTESVTWDTDEDKRLEASLIAEELLPDVYKLYDENTAYAINVYEDEKGVNLNNNFTITAEKTDSNGNYTTKVFNTKAGTIYFAPGNYTAGDVFTGFDFANTTVAFAVIWTPSLAPDTVVIDYGLDVIIDVATNDNMNAQVVGIRTDEPAGVTINSGTYNNPAKLQSLGSADTLWTADLESDNASVRFHMNKTGINAPETFYYESEVQYYDTSSVLQTTNMYSSVTVIPATTIYYEDSFLTLSGNWTVGTAQNATQDQDRPGEKQISEALDADNVYGHDSAYAEMSTHSLGSAAKITVDANSYGTASFDFWGTGFDVISMTSGATGTIMVDLYNYGSDKIAKSYFVDTYYGMTADGVLTPNSPNELYQVPVIKVADLTYGHYTAEITASYSSYFDHDKKDGYSYDLYVDAIRIYDPTGNESDIANEAYVADKEGWPTYTELRNNIIAASKYNVTENDDGTVTVTGDDLSGMIFIDSVDGTKSIADYVNYGPNNELYLAKDQAVSFKVGTTGVADVQLGIKVGNNGPIKYTINGDVYTVETTTDMYYSILEYAKTGTVTITNTDGGILSLTNIKITYPSDPGDVDTANLLWMDAESAGYALMSLRRAPVEEEPETTVSETTPEQTEPETTVPETTPEQTEPETTVPETTPEQTEPETTVPETTPEQTEPETTVPETTPEQTEPETTVPETTPEQTEPENDGSASNNIISIINKLVNFIGKLLSKWFR